MLWPRRQPERAGGKDVVRAVPLGIELDPRLFTQKFAVLLEALSQAGGVDPFLSALDTKSRLFQKLLAPEAVRDLSLEKVELLLETVMPARKRIWPQLVELGGARLASAVEELLYGGDELDMRVQAFVARVPDDDAADQKASKKRKRPVHDFAAELLHFRSPAQYPLMTRWVWDATTLTGALRELMKGGDTTSQIPPIGAAPGVYEAGRVWVAEQLAAQGVYREPHFVVDLFFAHAYSEYMQAMSSGMGLMQPHFGGKADPLDVLKKLLGIDDARRRESRVRKAAVH